MERAPKSRQHLLRSPLRHAKHTLRRSAAAGLGGVERWVTWQGFDRTVALARRLPLAGPLLLPVLARLIAPLDRQTSIRLAWAGRRLARDVALIQVATGLFTMHKYSACRWWAARPARSRTARVLLRDLAIEALFRENKVDDALALAATPDATAAQQHRVGAEAALRRGDTAQFEQHLAALGQSPVLPKRPYLRWLQVMASRLDRPTELLTPTQTGLALAASRKVQNTGEHRKLAALLAPNAPATGTGPAWLRFRDDLETLLATRAWGSAADLAAAAPAFEPKDLGSGAFAQLAALRADALASVGRAAEAEARLADDLDALLHTGDLIGAVRFFPHLFRRTPNSARATAAYAQVFAQGGFGQAQHLVQRWTGRPTPAQGLPERRSDTCFLIGNGPSLAAMDLPALAGHDIFCVNRGFQATSLGLPAPRFLAVMDPAVYRDYGREIDAQPVERLFLNPSCMLNRPADFGPHVSLMGTSQLFMSMGPLVPTPTMLHLGASLIVWVAQIAVLMGYRQINILGVDLSYSDPNPYFYASGAKESRRLASFREGDNGPALVNAGFANLQRVVGDRAMLRNVGIGGNLTALERSSLADALRG